MKKTAAERYRERLLVPEQSDGKPMNFRTSDGLLVAVGYERIVIGGRGPYLEFFPEQVVRPNLQVPPGQEWRLRPGPRYYVEHRSRDTSDVKFYEQVRPVEYADYRPGLWYASPFDLHPRTILSLKDPTPEEKRRIDAALRSMFGNRSAADVFLDTPHPDLDGTAPRKLMEKGKAAVVAEMLEDALLGHPS